MADPKCTIPSISAQTMARKISNGPKLKRNEDITLLIYIVILAEALLLSKRLGD